MLSRMKHCVPQDRRNLTPSVLLIHLEAGLYIMLLTVLRIASYHDFWLSLHTAARGIMVNLNCFCKKWLPVPY
jgi:hypothetical protein